MCLSEAGCGLIVSNTVGGVVVCLQLNVVLVIVVVFCFDVVVQLLFVVVIVVANKG